MTVHVFQSGSSASYIWADVVPGDLVISPETMGFPAIDKEGKKPIIFQQRPLFVLGKYDGLRYDEGFTDHVHVVTYIVLSRKGVFLVYKDKPERLP